MATLLDYVNNTVEDVTSIVKSIQKRYLDPYRIRLSTDTNNYVFVEDKINKMVSAAYGNNIVLSGLQIQSIDTSNTDYIDVYITKGLVIVDYTLIEFTDDMIIRVPRTWIDDTNTEYNIVGIDYAHVQTYPPRAAIPFVTKQSDTKSFTQIKIITAVFKLDNTTITYQNPKTGTVQQTITLEISDLNYEIKPPIDIIGEISNKVEGIGLTFLQALLELSNRVYNLRNEVAKLQQLNERKMNIEIYDNNRDGVVEKADYATYSQKAEYAENAKNAEQADNATNADNAANASNADKLDGIDSTQFARVDVDNTFQGANTFNNTISTSSDMEFTDSSKGPILIDRSTGTKYRIYVDSGSLKVESV